ncbi:MAG: tRNA (adenosine(37)-N6)-threonylcarbamoyltransferase complex ATPase subunit type 1 TsaE [Candidatus Blackburnbacteria bacterium]|nr:tRNA (adenosine(37)-N6)-threonylcarbamoyltransferase complex ATPase subunit type 1 TsaE [Candidatus Blackburnbacteria bacterium]
MEVFTRSARETAELGKSFADNLKGGETLALTGDLGSGKTTFVQGLARGLGITQRTISPTFILVREYEIAHSTQNMGHRRKLYHVDLYRLEEKVEQEVKSLGLEDIWGKEENVVVIEWAEKIAPILPKTAKWIKFESLDGERRKITFV